MLNALRHHGLFRSHPAQQTRPPTSAQRLAASRTISGGRVRGEPLRAHHVLNALRHHGLFRVRQARRARNHQLVLNALRHHGLFRPGLATLSKRPVNCAQRLAASRTISGRMESRHCATDVSAQRLAASRTISVGCSDAQRPWCGCSTPCGITDYFGRTSGMVGPQPRKRCSTPCGITDYFGLDPPGTIAESPGAQRLAASRTISEPKRHDRPRPYRCAQRLAASRTISVH